MQVSVVRFRPWAPPRSVLQSALFCTGSLVRRCADPACGDVAVRTAVLRRRARARMQDASVRSYFLLNVDDPSSLPSGVAMIGSMLGVGGTMRAALVAIAAVIAVLAVSARAGPGADTDAFVPVEEYARKVEEFTKNAPGLNKKIEEGTNAIESLTDAPKARSEIEQLRDVVADLLGRVSDNGELARLGAKALDQSRNKLKALEQDTRFKPEERQFLVDQWRELIRQTERAADDLDKARLEFAALMRTLQTREDFIDELLQIKRAAEAIKVIRQLTSELRDASEKLKTLIGGIKPPGA